MTPLDEMDRALLNRMQDDLPLVANPYAAVASEFHAGLAGAFSSATFTPLR